MPSQTEEQTYAIPTMDTWPRLSRGGETDGPYIVIVYNDDWHTFEEVIHQMQLATGCSYDKGMSIAVEIDREGRAVAYSGSETECERVASILREIRLQVETDRAI